VSRRRNASSFTSDRAREAAQKRWNQPPQVQADSGGGVGAQREAGGSTGDRLHELSGSDSFSARERLKWEAEHSPSATARVSAARALLDEEPRPDVSEPEVSGVPRGGVSLLDILAVAAACGMDLDALVAAAKARRRVVEAGYPALNPEPPKAPPKVSCGTR
jgi:hypothetical protein